MIQMVYFSLFLIQLMLQHYGKICVIHLIVTLVLGNTFKISMYLLIIYIS